MDVLVVLMAVNQLVAEFVVFLDAKLAAPLIRILVIVANKIIFWKEILVLLLAQQIKFNTKINV